MAEAVRFVRGWLGRPIGYVDRGLNYGQMESLVSRGVAVWHEDKDTHTGKRSKRPAQEKELKT